MRLRRRLALGEGLPLALVSAGHLLANPLTRSAGPAPNLTLLDHKWSRHNAIVRIDDNHDLVRAEQPPNADPLTLQPAGTSTLAREEHELKA
jgi:hypothetical protein